MIKVPFRGVLLGLIALVAIGGLIATNSNVEPKNSSAAAVKSGPCSSEGITLVIDQGRATSKSAQVFCITQFEGTGWELLEKAGAAPAGTAEYPKSFVCRISGFPDESTEDCLGTPGINSGSWVYLYASSDSAVSGNGSWLRSPQGAATRKPKCGDYEGWIFVSETNPEPTIPRIQARPFTCR